MKTETSKKRTFAYMAIIFGILLLTGCNATNTASTTSTTFLDGSPSSSTSTTVRNTGSTNTTTSVVPETSTSITTSTTTTAPTTTTSTIPVSNEAEVKIIRAQAGRVVDDFLDRASNLSIVGVIPLKEEDPFDGAAREFLQYRAGWVASIDDSVETIDWGTGPNPILDGSENKYYIPETFMKAGTGRIIPIGDGLYYVDGVYMAAGSLSGLVGGFHFKVVDGQAILVDMFVWDNSSRSAVRKESTQLVRGWRLSSRMVDTTQVFLTGASDANLQYTIERTFVNLVEGSTGKVNVILLVNNPTTTVTYRTGSQRNREIGGTVAGDGTYERLIDILLESNTEEEMVYILRAASPVAVAPGETRRMFVGQLLPTPVAGGYLTLVFDMVEIDNAIPVSVDAKISASITVDLDAPVRCLQMGTDDTVYGPDSCLTPRDANNS